MIEFVERYAASGRHSQNGEHGLLCEINKRFDLSWGVAVEIGGHDGLYCSNTAELVECGWSGLFVEADYNLYLKCKENYKNNPNVRCQCSRVDGRNVNAFVTDLCDLLSVDTDGADYEIFQGLIAKPKTVIVEIDSSIPPDVDGFNSDGGAGYGPMVELGIDKGYFLLCHTGNLIFVDRKYRGMFPEITGNPIVDHKLYFNRGWLKGAA